jgi:hypothetical protein
MKDVTMAWTCNIAGDTKVPYKVLMKKPLLNQPLGRLRKILKFILKK